MVSGALLWFLFVVCSSPSERILILIDPRQEVQVNWERGNCMGQFRLCSGNRTQSEFCSAPRGRSSLTVTVLTDSTVLCWIPAQPSTASAITAGGGGGGAERCGAFDDGAAEQCSGRVVERWSGGAAERHSSTVAQQHSGTAAERHSGGAAEWRSGTAAQRRSGGAVEGRSRSRVMEEQKLVEAEKRKQANSARSARRRQAKLDAAKGIKRSRGGQVRPAEQIKSGSLRRRV